MAKKAQYSSDYSFVLEEHIPFDYQVIGYSDWIEELIPQLYHAKALRVRPQREEQDLVPALVKLWSKNHLGVDLETGGESAEDGLDPIKKSSRVLLMQVGNRDKVYVVQPELIPFFKEVLESDKLLHINQNITFDFEWLMAKYRIHIVRMFCTMLAQQLLQAGLDGYSVSLLDLARTYPPCRLISKQVRGDFIAHKGAFTEDQIYYAARDVYLLFPIFDGQTAALRKHKLNDIAQIEFNAIPVTAEMELTGVLLHPDVMALIIDYWGRRQIWLEHRIKEVFNAELKKQGKKATPSAMDEVLEMLGSIDFENFDLDSNEQKLEALRRIGLNPENARRATFKEIDHELTRLMVEYSVVRKRTSTYGIPMLNRVHPDDGRLHPSFKQLGIGDSAWANRDRTQTIATGRYSSDFQQLPRPEEIYELITDPAELALVEKQFGLGVAA